MLFLSLFPSLLRNSGNKHKNNPLVSTETVRHLSTYIILYFFYSQQGNKAIFATKQGCNLGPIYIVPVDKVSGLVQSHLFYNKIIFLKNTDKTYSIASWLGPGMECSMQAHSLICILHWFLYPSLNEV